MKRRIILSVAIASLLVVVAAVHGEEGRERQQGSSLDRFAKLAGEWVGKGIHGDIEHEARIVYKVTSGGSAVVETIDPDGEHEMITVIHPDGDALLLTHYCMIGNQPQMKAQPKPGDNKVAFEFVKASNMKSDKEMHMHSVTFHFIDKDTLKTEWTNYNDGKEAGKAIFELKRKK